jgi:L-lactate dehydrogenase complex protein LldG
MPEPEDARGAVLARVGAAIREATPPVVERRYRRSRRLDVEEKIALFCERVGDYRATVERVDAGSLAEALERAAGSRTLVVPPGLPAALRPRGAVLIEDEGLCATALDAVDGALTGAALGIAETGTIVLDGDADQGRRAITLVPDFHLCVIPADRLVTCLPEAIDALIARDRETRPITFVSGPSATSDIELRRVEGVHGPRQLQVLVVEGTLRGARG